MLCPLCKRRVRSDDVLSKRPGCVNCRGYAQGNTLDAILAAYERGWILNTLMETRGNINQAAKLLGINRPTLYAKMKRLGITVTRHTESEPLDSFSGFV